jgi:hypothetical protein
MSSILGTSLSLYTSAQTAAATSGTTTATAPSLAALLTAQEQDGSSVSEPTTVTLSDQAKAYLAQSADSAGKDQPSTATLAANARRWLDDQYKTLGITSAMINGQTAIDLSGQSRATLSVIAANVDKQFSKDEVTAAANALTQRFDTAMPPYTVIARHTGNYAGLYEAAIGYMDEADPAERATDRWTTQRQALADGLSAARRSYGKAPDTGNPDDTVRALLDKPTAGGATGSDTSSAGVASRARAMLDDQANSAKDKGLQLVFDRGRKTGQQADFSNFDNRTLAAVAVNQDQKFSVEEVRAAKSELDLRTRRSILASLDPSTNGGGTANASLALIKQYSTMSAEEKSALGVTDAVMGRLVDNYRRSLSIQSAFSGGSNGAMSLGAYL